MTEALRFHKFQDDSIDFETTTALTDTLVCRLEDRGICEMSQLEVHALLGNVCCLVEATEDN
jgi:hypothetical protein